MQVRAKGAGLKIAPRKISLVAGLIRRRSVRDSLVILEHTPKRAAKLLIDVIKSAQANAEHNSKLNPDDLWVAGILVGPGPITKRYRPAAMGAVHAIRKRTSNVTVVLEDVPSPASKAQKAKPAMVKSGGNK